MRPRRLTSFLAALAVAACSSRDAAPDTSKAGGIAADSTTPASAVSWFDSVAPMILAPSHSNDRALLVMADSMAEDLAEGAIADPGSLVRLDGSIAAIRVSVSTGSEGCVDAAIQPAPAAPWGIGFVGRRPRALKVDSMRAISRQDSSALAPAIFRMASGVRNSPGGRFAGLAFSLVDLWRLRLPDSSIVIVATTKRQINQEDSPLEERTLLIAEGRSLESLTLAYSSRATGPEETVEGTELLAAVVFPGQVEIELIFGHDFGDQTSYSIVQRSQPGEWALRWSSRRFSC